MFMHTVNQKLAASIMLSGAIFVASSSMPTEVELNQYILSGHSYINKVSNDVDNMGLFTYYNNSRIDNQYSKNGTNIDPISFIENNFNVSSKDIAYIGSFNYAFGDLLELKKIIEEKYENLTSIELKRHTVAKSKSLMVEIHVKNEEEELDANIDKLFDVCDEWYSKTAPEFSEKIYIDVVA